MMEILYGRIYQRPVGIMIADGLGAAGFISSAEVPKHGGIGSEIGPDTSILVHLKPLALGWA